MITSMQNRTNFSVGINNQAEADFVAAMENRAEIKRRIAAMMSQLIKTDLGLWATMHEYSHNHTIEATLETLLHEFERIDALSEQAEINGLRAGL